MEGDQNLVECGQKYCMRTDPAAIELMCCPCTYCYCPGEWAGRWIYLPRAQKENKSSHHPVPFLHLFWDRLIYSPCFPSLLFDLTCLFLFQVPRIYWELSTRRVLLMEFMEGGQVNDRAYMERNGINVNEVVSKPSLNWGAMQNWCWCRRWCKMEADRTWGGRKGNTYRCESVWEVSVLVLLGKVCNPFWGTLSCRLHS